MISFLLVLLLLVILFLFFLLIILKIENNDVKNELASEKIDNGKSILGAPPKLDKKEIKNLGLRREILKSPNRKSSVSVITVAQLDILHLIAISG